MEKLNDRGNNIPCLYGAIVLSFPPDTVAEVLDQVLPQGTRYRKYPEYTECVMTEIRDFPCFEVDTLLTRLFAECDLEKIHEILNCQQARVLVDISFHHYDTFPALVFEGKNMEIIRSLRADIAIDPY